MLVSSVHTGITLDYQSASSSAIAGLSESEWRRLLLTRFMARLVGVDALKAAGTDTASNSVSSSQSPRLLLLDEPFCSISSSSCGGVDSEDIDLITHIRARVSDEHSPCAALICSQRIGLGM
jgi:hypothetical protein